MSNFYKNKSSLSSNLFSGGIITRVFVLCTLVILSAFSASAQTNTLADGTYYIRKAGTSLYLGRGLTGGTLTFKAIEADSTKRQRFIITKQTNGRYKIAIESANGTALHVNENGILPGTTNAFDLAWHTFNIYYSGANNLYAIQTAQSAGTYCFSINYSTNVLVGKSGNFGLKDVSPVSYPFELVPYSASLADNFITFPAIANKNLGDADFDPGATNAGNLPISYESSNVNVATIVDGKVHIVGSGTTLITAKHSGDANTSAAQSIQWLNVKFPANSLTSYYKFNDNLNDENAKYNGSAVGTPSYVTGRSGNAINTNGTSDFLTLQQGILATHDEMTIAAWVYRNATANWTRLFDFGDHSGHYMFLTPGYNNTNKVRFAMKCNNGTEQTITVSTANLIPVNTWTHVALTLNAAGAGKIYINGVEQTLEGTVPTFNKKPSDFGATTQNLISRSQFSDPYLNAAIDEFRIYNYALDVNEINTLFQTTLPVHLTGFNAKLVNTGSVLLNWTTASESNNSYFILERGNENKDFVKIATVNSKGNSGAAYSFTDNNVQNGINYYRLSQVDKDGTSKEIGLEQVSASLSKASIFNIYPNPVKTSSFTINYADNGAAKVSVKITDLAGNEVYQNVFPVNANGSYTIQSGSLNPGVYVVTVNNTSKKIIKE